MVDKIKQPKARLKALKTQLLIETLLLLDLCLEVLTVHELRLF